MGSHSITTVTPGHHSYSSGVRAHLSFPLRSQKVALFAGKYMFVSECVFVFVCLLREVKSLLHQPLTRTQNMHLVIQVLAGICTLELGHTQHLYFHSLDMEDKERQREKDRDGRKWEADGEKRRERADGVFAGRRFRLLFLVEAEICGATSLPACLSVQLQPLPRPQSLPLYLSQQDCWITN